MAAQTKVRPGKTTKQIKNKTKQTHFQQWLSFLSSHRWPSGCFHSGCHWRRCGCCLRSPGGSPGPGQLRFWSRPGSRRAAQVSWGRSRLTGGCSWGWCAPSRAGILRSAGRQNRPLPGSRGHRHRCVGRCPGENRAAGSRHCYGRTGWCLRHGRRKFTLGSSGLTINGLLFIPDSLTVLQ